MKKHIWIALLALTAGFSSCKKDDNSENEETVTNLALETGDNLDLKSESDQINSDIDQIVRRFASLNGVVAEHDTVCDCAVADSTLKYKMLILTFNGAPTCVPSNRTRTGIVEVSLVAGSKWSDAKAMLKVAFTNFKVLRQSDNKSWNFNGVRYLTNVRARNWNAILEGKDSIQIKERGRNLKVDVAGGQITYNLARLVNWKYLDRRMATIIVGDTIQVLQLSAMGDTTLDGSQNTDTWGTNRYGKEFNNRTNTRVLSNINCGLAKPLSGELAHKSNGNRFILTMGVGSDGRTYTGSCAYGWKLNYLMSNGATGEKVYSY